MDKITDTELVEKKIVECDFCAKPAVHLAKDCPCHKVHPDNFCLDHEKAREAKPKAPEEEKPKEEDDSFWWSKDTVKCIWNATVEEVKDLSIGMIAARIEELEYDIKALMEKVYCLKTVKADREKAGEKVSGSEQAAIDKKFKVEPTPKAPREKKSKSDRAIDDLIAIGISESDARDILFGAKFEKPDRKNPYKDVRTKQTIMGAGNGTVQSDQNSSGSNAGSPSQDSGSNK